jgi:hypothetical protein
VIAQYLSTLNIYGHLLGLLGLPPIPLLGLVVGLAVGLAIGLAVGLAVGLAIGLAVGLVPLALVPFGFPFVLEDIAGFLALGRSSSSSEYAPPVLFRLGGSSSS